LYLIGSRARYVEELQGIIRDSGNYPGVLVDNLALGGERMGPGVTSLVSLHGLEGSYLLCPSPPGIRYQIVLQLGTYLLKPEPALIHPSSSLDATVLVGRGTTINKIVSIGAHTVLGDHNQVNRSASIGHDCRFQSFVTVGPGATIASSVELKAGVFVGAGAVVLPGVTVGANAIVGAGAVVTKNVPDFATVVGNPAAVTKVGESGFGGHHVPLRTPELDNGAF
jgi:sugar O-acyltransferase (sialic acid O-acetyltransferase NeuD family)